MAGAVAVATLALTLTGCRAVIDWIGGDAAQATSGRSDGGTGGAQGAASDSPACPTGPELDSALDSAAAGALGGAAGEAVPSDLSARIEELLAHDAVTSRQVSVSIWVDGWGEVAAHRPDEALKPASNQKLLVAVGALELLPHDRRLETLLLATAPVTGGRIEGDLVLVGGGDPTLWDVGEHSIYEMAARLAELGVTEVSGSLYVDESRYDRLRIAQGWTDQQIPGDAAPISALTVRANRIDDTYGYLADPARGNGEVFLGYLADQGVAVRGGMGTGQVPEGAGEELVALRSPTVVQLVDSMLRNSDNTTAELLLKEIDREVGGAGSTLGGLAAAREMVEGWCVPLDGRDDDGSGLSYANARSAREWRRLLQGAQAQTWWPELEAGLPVAGDADGTLAGRLTGEATAGNLRAKTGTINVARALSGVFTTAGGRQATFSIIVNGDDPTPALGPTDLLLEAVAAHPG